MRRWALTAALALATACVDRSNDAPHGNEAPPEQTRPTVEEVRVEREPPPGAEVLQHTEPPVLTQAPHDSPPVVERGAIVATLQLPGGTASSDLALAAENIQPGISQLLRNQAPALLRDTIGVELRGVDLDACITLLLVDPAAHELPLALLVAVEDLDALRSAVAQTKRELRERDGLALIGPPAVVAAVEHYAFEQLRTAADHSELVLYPARLTELLAPPLHAALASRRSEDGSAVDAVIGQLAVYGPLLEDLLTQADRVVVSVTASHQSTDMFIRIYPRPNTELQGLIAAQAPASHELLAQLPAADPALLVSGTFRAGAAADSIVDASAAGLAGLFQSDMGTDAYATALRAWTASIDGRLAFSVELEGPALTPRIWAAFGTADAATTRSAWRSLRDTLARAKASVGTDVQFQRDVAEHDGVSIDRYSLHARGTALNSARVSAYSPEYDFAVFDDVMVAASERELPRLIDAVRGKQAGLQLSGRAALALANSRALGESLFYYADLSRLDAPGGSEERPFTAMVTAIGKHGEALSVRLSLLE